MNSNETDKRKSGRTRTVNVHIDNLVLDGFHINDTSGIKDALTSELQRLCRVYSSRMEYLENRDVEVLSLPAMEVTPGTSPRRIGRQIARSLAERILRAEKLPR